MLYQVNVTVENDFLIQVTEGKFITSGVKFSQDFVLQNTTSTSFF